MSVATDLEPRTAARPTPRSRNSLAAILADHGVTLVPTTQAGTRQRLAGKTCAAGTLAKLHRQHGADHLRDVLTVILQSEGNELALTAPIITAVSAVLLGHPDWYARDAGRFLEVVDRVDLRQLHERARRHRGAGVEAWKAVATLLCAELEGAFEPAREAA